MSSVPSQFRVAGSCDAENAVARFPPPGVDHKMVEAASIAIFSICMAFLCVFIADRLTNTPSGCAPPCSCWHWPAAWSRRCICTTGFGGIGNWNNLARLLSRKLPRIGDQLLGVIELSHSEAEQARSRTLCKAAIEQVATRRHNIATSAMRPPNRATGCGARWPPARLSCACVLFAAFPAAASNAFVRFAAPWSNTPRYTFTGIQPLPETLVVPHGEPFNVVARLTENTVMEAGTRHGPLSTITTRLPPSCKTAPTASSCRRKSNRHPCSCRSAIGALKCAPIRKCGRS